MFNIRELTSNCFVYCEDIPEEFECKILGIRKRTENEKLNKSEEYNIDKKLYCNIESEKFSEQKLFNDAINIPNELKEYDPSCCNLFQDLPRKKTDNDIQRIKKKQRELQTKLPSIEDAVIDYRLGFKPAFNYIYNYFESKMKYMARDKSKNNDVIYDDLMSELSFQLMQSVNKYKNGSVKFNTFFWRCAQNAVGMYFTRKNAKKRSSEYGEISINTMVDEDTEMNNFICDERSESLFEKANIKCVWENTIKPILGEQEAKILRMTVEGYDMNEIGKMLGLTRSAIYSRVKNAKEKIQRTFSEEQIQELFMVQ